MGIDTESIGSLRFNVDGGEVDLPVFLDASGSTDYYVTTIKRECFVKLFENLRGGTNIVSSKGIDEDERDRFFPEESSSVTHSDVVISGPNGAVLREELVNFSPRMFLKAKVPSIVAKVSAMVKEVFDANTDVEEVIVKVDVSGREIPSGFDGIESSEDTGEF